jgi:O-Antigen ligase
MPEHIRAFIAVLFLSLIGFAFVKKIIQDNVSSIEINRWRMLWFSLTASIFLAQNFWIYIVLASLILLYMAKKEQNLAALYFVSFVTIPPMSKAISGLGIVNYLFFIDHLRLVSLIILLPAAFSLSKNNDFKFTKCKTDIFILAYMFLVVVLYIRDTTFTDTLREALYTFIDIFLPYYVVSRSIKNIKQLNLALFGFVCIAFIVAFIVIFESLRHWLLYSTLSDLLDARFGYGGYLGRGDSLRAIGSLTHPIALGLYMSVALGLYFYLSDLIPKPINKKLGFVILVFGLLAPISRGPWTGAAVMLVVYILQGKKVMKRLSVLTVIGTVGFISLFFVPNGQKYLNLIPFYGKTETFNIDYREKLIQNSMIVIGKSPFFGSTNYLQTPEMQAMIQGQGIIDIVNQYIAILLETGYVGLFLFLGAFISTLLGIRKQMRLFKNNDLISFDLGRSLVSVICAIMAILVGAANVGAIGSIYWSILGVGVAYWRITGSQKTLIKE